MNHKRMSELSANATLNPECGNRECPKCKALCGCFDHVEVDNGVGIQTGEHQWLCETCGLFAFDWDGNVRFCLEANNQYGASSPP